MDDGYRCNVPLDVVLITLAFDLILDGYPAAANFLIDSAKERGYISASQALIMRQQMLELIFDNIRTPKRK